MRTQWCARQRRTAGCDSPRRGAASPRRRSSPRGPRTGHNERVPRPCSAGGVDQEQRLTELDRVRVLDEDLDDPPGHLRFDLVHELHRFEDAEDLSFLDEIADAHVRLRGRRRGAVEGADHRRLDGDPRGGVAHRGSRRDLMVDRRAGRGRCGRGRLDAAALKAYADLPHRRLDLRQPELAEQDTEPAREIDDRAVLLTARARSARHQRPAVATRPRYSPVRVSTFTTSPTFRNRGTWTTAPVSSVAGFVPPWAVSPRTPGSVRAMASSTKLGRSTATGAPATYRTSTSAFSCR